jgi:hypothetical protein
MYIQKTITMPKRGDERIKKSFALFPRRHETKLANRQVLTEQFWLCYINITERYFQWTDEYQKEDGFWYEVKLEKYNGS